MILRCLMDQITLWKFMCMHQVGRYVQVGFGKSLCFDKWLATGASIELWLDCRHWNSVTKWLVALIHNDDDRMPWLGKIE